jgi:hypothetical protein
LLTTSSVSRRTIADGVEALDVEEIMRRAESRSPVVPATFVLHSPHPAPTRHASRD